MQGGQRLRRPRRHPPPALDGAQMSCPGRPRFGIGADQILHREAPRVDFGYRINGGSGDRIEDCSNGASSATCATRAQRQDHARGRDHEPPVVLRLADGGVTVDMGPPDFDPAAVRFDTTWIAPRATEGGLPLWPLELGEGRTVEVALVSMGNPHAVQIVTDVDAAPVATLGPKIEKHARFAEGVNAGFTQVVSRSAIRLRVYERGAGETLACGTGACAAVVAGIRLGLLDARSRRAAAG
jgi:diaminopimelate epimerase